MLQHRLRPLIAAINFTPDQRAAFLRVRNQSTIFQSAQSPNLPDHLRSTHLQVLHLIHHSGVPSVACCASWCGR